MGSLVVAMGLTLGPGLFLGAGARAAEEENEGIEEIEEIEDVEAIMETGGVSSGPWGLVGRFHVAVVHFPIAWLLMTLLLDLLAFRLGRKELADAGRWTLGLGVLSFGPAVATGLLRERTMGLPEATRALVEVHETLVLAALAVATAALLWRWRSPVLPGHRRVLYLALMAVACGLVAAGAHWGGKVAWGPDHLPF